LLAVISHSPRTDVTTAASSDPRRPSRGGLAAAANPVAAA
jgi:hypothetical protein